MSEQELPNLQGVGDCLIADVALHVPNENFLFDRSHKRRQLLSLRFSESLDRRGVNLAARTYKINKAPTVVCRLEEGVQSAIRGRVWAINLGGLCFLSDSPQAELQAVVQIHVRVGILGPHVGFDLYRPSE